MAFGNFIENAKKTIINLIRDQFKDEGWAYEEMPKMEKFNFYSKDPYETFVRALTSLPDIDQQLPLIAVTVGSSVGIPMGIGISGDYIGMVTDDDGYYYKRYSCAVNMTINIDIGSEDENTRTELVDIVLGLFQFYMRERGWEYNPPEDSEDMFQIIFDKIVNVMGENEIPKPEGDVYDKIFVNRLSFNVTMIDYVDRLAAGQGKTGPGVDEAHKGPISVEPDPDGQTGETYSWK